MTNTAGRERDPQRVGSSSLSVHSGQNDSDEDEFESDSDQDAMDDGGDFSDQKMSETQIRTLMLQKRMRARARGTL